MKSSAPSACAKMASSKGPIPEWNVREQLILASAVQRSGDQNWVSVSRAVKPLVEDARPPDYFSQKNCALQYSEMLDKANHPKRKRSSDGTPESVATVEEQIVRQLTEKRLTTLGASIMDTKKEYHALKKEIEQIERGELDSELPKMWEKIQAELALKESTESKPSKSKLSAAGSKQEEQSRRQKSASSSSQKDDRAKATGERAQASKAPDRVPSTASEVQSPAVPPSSPSTREGVKMETSPSETPLILPPVSTPPSTSTPTSATKAHSKKKSVEALSLSGEAAAVAHEESPLPFPMTVPKEEQLHASMVAGGLSHALSQPLSPDMHIIVQQPNIAAIANSGSSPTVREAMEIDFKSTAVLTQQQAQPLQTQAPSQPPPSSSPQSQTVKEKVPPLDVGVVTLAAPSQPKLVATQPSTGQAPLSALKLVLKPSQSPVVTNQLTQSPTPTLPSATTSPLAVSASLSQAQPVKARVQPEPRLPLQSTSRLVTHTMRSPSITSAPSNLSHISPSSAHPPPSHTPHPLPPITLSSPTTTVVSSVLADPRLSAATLRPGVRVPPPQVALPQPQVLVPAPLKPKQQVKVKSKTLEEMEKKSLSVEESVSKPTDVAKKVEKQEEVWCYRGVAKKVEKQEEGYELPKTEAEVQEPSLTTASLQASTAEQKAGHDEVTVAESSQPQEPEPTLDTGRPEAVKPAVTTEVRAAEGGEERKAVEEQEAEEGMAEEVAEVKAVEEERVVKEKAEESRVEAGSPRSPLSPRVKREDRDQFGEMEEDSSKAVEEQIPPEGGSSRHSSVSELPSSPLTSSLQALGPGDEEGEGDGMQSKGKRLGKQSSKKLWSTRSRKRKLELDEGMSVESTDLESEEEPSSLFASAAPSPAPSQGDADQEMGISQKQWKKAIMLVWRHAAQHKYANLFLHPVKEDDAPGYREVIHRPMDLSTIKRNIENGAIKTDIEFQRDMLLMFQNAFMYNSSDHDVYHMAEKMRADVMQSIQDYLTTQLQLIVESSTPKVLRSRDREGRKDAHDEGTPTPAKKRRTRADD